MLAATAYTGSHFPPEMPSNWVIFTWFSNVSPFISANATPSATTWLDDQKIKSNNSHSFRNQVLLKVWSRPRVVVQECVSGHDKGVASIEEKGVLRGSLDPKNWTSVDSYPKNWTSFRLNRAKIDSCLLLKKTNSIACVCWTIQQEWKRKTYSNESPVLDRHFLRSTHVPTNLKFSNFNLSQKQLTLFLWYLGARMASIGFCEQLISQHAMIFFFMVQHIHHPRILGQ